MWENVMSWFFLFHFRLHKFINKISINFFCTAVHLELRSCHHHHEFCHGLFFKKWFIIYRKWKSFLWICQIEPLMYIFGVKDNLHTNLFFFLINFTFIRSHACYLLTLWAMTCDHWHFSSLLRAADEIHLVASWIINLIGLRLLILFSSGSFIIFLNLNISKSLNGNKVVFKYWINMNRKKVYRHEICVTRRERHESAWWKWKKSQRKKVKHVTRVRF